MFPFCAAAVGAAPSRQRGERPLVDHWRASWAARTERGAHLFPSPHPSLSSTGALLFDGIFKLPILVACASRRVGCSGGAAHQLAVLAGVACFDQCDWRSSPPRFPASLTRDAFVLRLSDYGLRVGSALDFRRAGAAAPGVRLRHPPRLPPPAARRGWNGWGCRLAVARPLPNRVGAPRRAVGRHRRRRPHRRPHAHHGALFVYDRVGPRGDAPAALRHRTARRRRRPRPSARCSRSRTPLAPAFEILWQPMLLCAHPMVPRRRHHHDGGGCASGICTHAALRRRRHRPLDPPPVRGADARTARRRPRRRAPRR